MSAMCTILQHGGPDDEGIFINNKNAMVLGHRRLALIDLSACGHQPMSYNNDRYTISYNGEIYNYKELRSELMQSGYTFSTASDTEVILAAFAAWGTMSFSRLNGMFAFALWDNEEEKLFLVRDPSGIKPLYVAHTNEGLVFSSEMKGFRPIEYLQEEHENWKIFMMAYGHLPEPVTTLKKVVPLKKGTYACYNTSTNELFEKQYVQNNYEEIQGNRAQAIEQLKAGMSQAVKRHLISDAPIGVFLSGGLDSSVLTLLAHEVHPTHLSTLSLYFSEEDYSEKKFQDLLINQLHCTYNQQLLEEENFHANLPSLLQDMDMPSCDGINTWFISRFAKSQGLKAVLSGIGGDEYLGGYPSFARMKKVKLLEKMPAALLSAGKYTALKSLKRLGYLSLGGVAGKYLFLRGQFIPFEIADRLNVSEAYIWKVLKENADMSINHLSNGNQASFIEVNYYMQNQLLRDVDVMSMAHGIEIRVPFLDKNMLNLFYRLKSNVKYNGQWPKQLLVDAYKDRLPAPIWKREKMGFGFPFRQWLANDEYIKSLSMAKEYTSFVSDNIHWSQFLTSMLIRKFEAA